MSMLAKCSLERDMTIPYKYTQVVNPEKREVTVQDKEQ